MTALEGIGIFACIVGGGLLLGGAVWLVFTVIDTIAHLQSETSRRIAEDAFISDRLETLRVRVAALEKRDGAA